MILKSIRLRGFKGVRSGMGLDELFLDLTALPDGLIAVTGQNGAGKTTLLDNLHPYRLQPFKIRKAKDWSPSAFSYYDQCFGSDACKELVFEMDGVKYKSLILIDAERRKQECYLYRGGLSSRDWQPLNDGKTKTYDEAVEKVCGSPSLFFTSVFRCQGAKNLSDYTRGDIMSVISELLNIDHIREQADKCRSVGGTLSAGLAALRSKIDELRRESEVVSGLQHRISERDASIANDHLLLADTKKLLDAAQCELNSAKERKSAQVSELERLNMLRSQLSAEQGRLRDADAALQKVTTDYDKRIADLKAAHERFKSDLGGKVARAEKIVSGCEAIREAVDNEVVLVANIERINGEITALRAEREELQKQHAEYDKRLSAVLADIKAAEAAAGRLDGLDCRADGTGWLNPDCRLISAAVKQQESLPSLRETAVDLERRVAEDKVGIDAYSIRLGTAIDQYDAAVVKRDECRKFTRLLPELELAESSLVEWCRDMEDRERAFASDLKTLEGEKWHDESSADLARMKISDSVRGLETQIASFPAFADEDVTIRELSIKCGSLMSAVDGYEKRIREGELAVSALKAKLEIANERLASADDLIAKSGRYEREIAKFSLLQKACSNDGIIALELDDAAPSIAAIVNDLLRSCYGSRFTIRLDTQSARLDGSLKEDFDIVIFDSETGDERSVTEMSGGQAAYINDALTRGICLFNIQSRGKTYGTLFADEVDGALDADRKLEFLNIKREALRIGSHAREFFISQSPDLIELADARIVLQPGIVTIQ